MVKGGGGGGLYVAGGTVSMTSCEVSNNTAVGNHNQRHIQLKTQEALCQRHLRLLLCVHIYVCTVYIYFDRSKHPSEYLFSALRCLSCNNSCACAPSSVRFSALQYVRKHQNIVERQPHRLPPVCFFDAIACSSLHCFSQVHCCF